MTTIIRNTSKGQLLTFRFAQDQAAASQAAAAMNTIESHDGTTLSVLDVQEEAVPFAFDLVAVTVSASAARTGGTLTADVSLNGTATGLQAALNATDTQWATAHQPRGEDRGVAGDRVGVLLTTDASWAPATADIVVTVAVIAYLEGV